MRKPIFALALLAGCATGDLHPHETFVWEMEDSKFGGFSGLAVSADGSEFWAQTDRGTLFRGRFLREDGRIVGIAGVSQEQLLIPAGTGPLWTETDAEGLAVLADGTILISVERKHLVRRFSGDGSTGEDLPRHPDFDGMISNAALEGLAVAEDGSIWTIPERSGRQTFPFNVYKFDGEAWQIPFTIPRRGAFVVSGADIFEGHLYVLERDFVGLGFRTRVRRFNLDGSDETVLIETPAYRHDNLEGISLWRTEDGQLRLTLISDDNFNWAQRTEIVEYSLPD